MKTKRRLSRYALARRLHYLALQISADKPVKIGGRSTLLPDCVGVEEELVFAAGETELEFEIHWPSPARLSPLKAAPATATRRTARRVP